MPLTSVAATSEQGAVIAPLEGADSVRVPAERGNVRKRPAAPQQSLDVIVGPFRELPPVPVLMGACRFQEQDAARRFSQQVNKLFGTRGAACPRVPVDDAQTR